MGTDLRRLARGVKPRGLGFARLPTAQDLSNKADFVGLSPRLLSIGLSP